MIGSSFARVFLGCAAALCASGAQDAAAGECGDLAPTTYLAASFDDAFPIHGVAGDRTVLFLVQPSAGLERAPGVHVVERFGGRRLGDLPPPADGWGVPLSPFITRLPDFPARGELILTDVRVGPAVVVMGGPVPAEVYRYSYARAPGGRFEARLEETWTLPAMSPGAPFPDGFLYVGSLTVLPGGEVVITDSLDGAIWVADRFGAEPRLAAIDPRLAPAPIGAIQGVQRAPGGGLRDYTMVLPAPPGGPSVGPGIESVTYAAITDEICVTPPAQGGIYCIARGALLDAATPPFAKSLRPVLPALHGLTDLTDGIVADRFQPSSPWLYWHRAPSDASDYAGSGENTLRRVNLVTGAVEVVAESNLCFDWTYEITTLPPIFPYFRLTSILSSVGQSPNNPEINVLLGGVPAYVAPTPVPITVTTAD